MSETALQRLPEVDPKDPFIQKIYEMGRMFSRFFDTEIIGDENIPREGRVMLVGNHALMGIDTWALLPELVARTERIPRGMGLRALFDVPLLGEFLREVGMVSGDRDSAIELLGREEMVLTYPGGARDSLKGSDQRNKLQWGERLGFAHVAVMGQSPVVPVVGVGPDDCFKVLGSDGLIPTRGLGSASLKLPLFLPILKRVAFDFHVGAPLQAPELDVEAASDSLIEEATRDFASDVQTHTQALLDRASLWRDRLGSSRSMR